MIYILDTAELEAIKHCNEYYPLAGVTTNPSIIAKENRNFWDIVKEIRDNEGNVIKSVGTTVKRQVISEETSAFWFCTGNPSAAVPEPEPHLLLFD